MATASICSTATGAALIGIQSLDTRAAELAAELDAAAGSQMHAIGLQRPWPSQTPVLLAWLKRHRPDLYARAGTLLFAKDVLTCHLTGTRASDISDMSGAGLLRLPEAVYDTGLLALYGLEDAEPMLPPLHRSDRRRRSGHSRGSRGDRIGGGHAGGRRLFRCRRFSARFGRGRSGRCLHRRRQLVDQPGVLGRTRCATSASSWSRPMVPSRFVNMENSATSAANLEWYVRTLVERGGHHDDPFGFVNEAVGAVTPAHDDPLFHPFLYGGRQGAHQRGGFFGLAGWHGEGHMLRALFEGVMFEHRRHIEVLAQAGVSFSKAALSGGGARSAHWPQIFADGLGVPVTVAECQRNRRAWRGHRRCRRGGTVSRRGRCGGRDDPAQPVPSRQTPRCARTMIAATASGRD